MPQSHIRSMKDKFFISENGRGTRKRRSKSNQTVASQKQNGGAEKDVPNKKRSRARKMDEEISSDEDGNLNVAADRDQESDSEEERETAAEKRIRLANAYIEHIKTDAAGGADEDAGMLDQDLVADRLHNDALEAKGWLWRTLSYQYSTTTSEPVKFPRGHQSSITCVAVDPLRRWIFTGGKDGAIIKWDAETGKRLHVTLGLVKKAPKDAVGHTKEVLCIAASSKYIATGGADKRLNIWNAADSTHLRLFSSHRDGVTGLCFRKNTNQLYSCSRDRTVKTWDLDEMTFVETLFGHQEAITCIDTVAKDRCVTGGGRDKTMRAWKIAEESQLVFRASSSLHGSLDCVYQVTEEYFLSGDDHGTISLWHNSKKKACHSVTNAHGLVPLFEAEVAAQVPPKPYWITSICGVKFSDLFFTGSWNGEIKCWRLLKDKQSFEFVNKMSVPGVINSMAIIEPLNYPSPIDKSTLPTKPLKAEKSRLQLVAACGQEHKDGRWWKVKQAKNVVYTISIYPLVHDLPTTSPNTR